MSDDDSTTEEDLKEVLTGFWLDAMRDADNTWPERIKSSELLAKYILGEGKTPLKKRGPTRPNTAEILKLATALEAGNGFTYERLEEELDGDGEESSEETP